MKIRKSHLLLLTLVACATPMQTPPSQIPTSSASQSTTSISTVSATATPAAANVSAAVKLSTPKFNLPSAPSTAMIEATKFYAQYANSDEFYVYARAHAKPLQGGNETSLDNAIKKTRECLNASKEVTIMWGRYSPWSAAIGGWDGVGILQNSRVTMNSIERAGHWYHEITHLCGFSHIDNNISKFPIIRESWPYQGGYMFEDFLTSKQQSKLAGE